MLYRASGKTMSKGQLSQAGPRPARFTLSFESGSKKEQREMRFANGARRGYATLDITPSRCIARLRTVNSAGDRDSAIYTLATFAIEDGKPGAHRT